MTVFGFPVLDDNYTWVIHDETTQTTSVVDPALTEPVIEFLEQRQWSLDYILNTHHHRDHIDGILGLKKKYHCQVFGPFYDRHRIPGLDTLVKEGDEVSIGADKGTVLFLPGHTHGHIAYWFKSQNILFCGDVLFALGCGRLFEGSPSQMWHSLDRLRQLPALTQVFCAHEYTYENARFALSVDSNNLNLQKRMSWIENQRRQNLPTIPFTLQDELATNPFLRPESSQIRSHLGLEILETSNEEVFAKLRSLKDHFR